MDPDFEREWNSILEKLAARFGGDPDIQAVLFLIGMQELGQGYRQLNKDQKLDVLHVAMCRLLSRYGYYEYEGTDAEGWPHWKATAKLPHLKPAQQHELMKQAIVEYFREHELPN